MAIGEFAGTPRFEILRRIRAGGMGVVYEAFDRQRGMRVALKTLPRLEGSALYRFKHEFRLLSDLAHDNLVRLHELVSENGTWFFTMEFVSGTDFVSYVWENAGPDGVRSLATTPAKLRTQRPDYRRLRAALRQLAQAVHTVHEAGKLHRDIKPANILVEASGRVVLLDFGLGMSLDDTGGFEFGHVFGTAGYMAPEQSELGGATPAADWYAVGTLLFEALTGRVPFEGSSMDVLLQKRTRIPPRPSELCEGIPADLDTLCCALLSLEANERPTGAEVLRRLGVHAFSPPQSGSFALRNSIPPAGLVGRSAELQTLRVAYEASRSGRSAEVHVTGRSGMGKSALVRHFLGEVSARGPALILSGRCYEHESVPYKGFDAVIDALSRKLSALPPEECADLLPPDARALACVFPVLDRVRAIAALPRDARALGDPHQLRSRAFAALRELLGRLAKKRSVVIHIDDLQWGDADSAALLGELTASRTSLGVLVVIAYRSEDVHAQPWLVELARTAQGHGAVRSSAATGPFTSVIAVDKLTADDALGLSASLLDVPLSDAIAVAIAAESGGSPFFIEELVRYAQSSEAEAEALRLEDVVESRLRALPAGAMRMLELAAVAGRPLDTLVACEVLQLGSGDGDAAVAQLCASRLLRRSAGFTELVEPYHDRIRESVLATLEPQRRLRYHERLARVLEAQGNVDPDELFAHFAAAELASEASLYARAAAERATLLLAFDRAAELYRRALALSPADSQAQRELRILVADSLARAGRGAAAAEAYGLAAEGEQGALGLDLRRKASEQLLFSGHIDRGLTLVSKVLAQVNMRLASSPLSALLGLLWVRFVLALRGNRFALRKEQDVDPALLARIDACSVVANGLSFVDNIQGKLFQARAYLDALRAGEPARIVHALAGESIFRAVDGQRALPEALGLLDHAKHLMENEGVADHAGSLDYGRGMVYHITGHWPEAHECFVRAERLLADARASYYRVELDGAQSYGVTVLVLLGRLAEARRRHAELRREAENRNDLFLGTNLCIGLPAQCWLFDDQPDVARMLAADAMARWSLSGFHLQHWHELTALTSIDLYEGEAERALERMRTRFGALQRSMLLRIEYIRLYAFYMRAACNLAMATRNERVQKPFLREVEADAARLDKSGARWAGGLAAMLRASSFAMQGDVARSIVLLERAVITCNEASLALFASVCERRLGELRGGNDGAALLRKSDAWMVEQGVKQPERVAAMIVPFRRQP